MPVDSFRYLPRSFRQGYESFPYQHDTPAWAPLTTPIEHATIALLTSAGVYIEGEQPPFDLDRERTNPTWGDPTYRLIPRDIPQDRVGVAHLHINNRDIRQDLDVALPLRTFEQLETEGRLGKLADQHYSFMGFQDSNLTDWRRDQAPEVAQRLQDAGVSALILAPA